jgi:RimJ/RimL family protein N-acetyltransferase
LPLPYPDPPLADGVVLLRRWTLGDLDCVERASRDARIPEGTTVPARYDDAEGRAWIERQWSRAESGEGLSLAVADAATGEALGAAVLMLRPQPGAAGIGYWLVEGARGRGLASRAVALLSRWALGAGGLARVEALVEPSNVASQRVVERAGFRREGHLRSYLVLAGRRADALVYSLLPGDLD